MASDGKSELIDELRWRKQKYGFETPEKFEERRGEAWFSPNTRNHRQDADMISREEREMSNRITVDDERASLLSKLVVGRTITGFHREPNSGDSFEQFANTITLTLDDGSQLIFEGLGYDASSVDTTYVVPE